MTDQQGLVFISYARRDGEAAADRLRERLSDDTITGVRLNLWQDLVSMQTGNWWQQIKTAIATGDHLVMVVTPGALQSRVCGDEWWLARTEGKGINPILLADSALARGDLPSFMRAEHVYRLELDAPNLAEDHEWTRACPARLGPRHPRRGRRRRVRQAEPGRSAVQWAQFLRTDTRARAHVSWRKATPPTPCPPPAMALHRCLEIPGG